MQPFEIDVSSKTFWVDAQLSPSIARWLINEYNVKAHSLRALELLDADDIDIFRAAKNADAVLITKDKDMVMLLDQLKQPPKIIWLTCGNTSNKAVKHIFGKNFQHIVQTLFIRDEPLIEVAD